MRRKGEGTREKGNKETRKRGRGKEEERGKRGKRKTGSSIEGWNYASGERGCFPLVGIILGKDSALSYSQKLKSEKREKEQAGEYWVLKIRSCRKKREREREREREEARKEV